MSIDPFATIFGTHRGRGLRDHMTALVPSESAYDEYEDECARIASGDITHALALFAQAPQAPLVQTLSVPLCQHLATTIEPLWREHTENAISRIGLRDEDAFPLVIADAVVHLRTERWSATDKEIVAACGLIIPVTKATTRMQRGGWRDAGKLIWQRCRDCRGHAAGVIACEERIGDGIFSMRTRERLRPKVLAALLEEPAAASDLRRMHALWREQLLGILAEDLQAEAAFVVERRLRECHDRAIEKGWIKSRHALNRARRNIIFPPLAEAAAAQITRAQWQELVALMLPSTHTEEPGFEGWRERLQVFEQSLWAHAHAHGLDLSPYLGASENSA